VFEGSFALALTAGMVATVNPCGFAMLPAYLSTFVGLDQRANRLGAVARALAVASVLTAGFVTVFGLLGIVFGSALDEVLDQAQWLTIAIGMALVALGGYLLTGRPLSLAVPKLDRGGHDGTLASMYLYGVSYAIASLSCSILPFASVTSSSATGNFVSRLLTFVLYGAGMGMVMAVLTVAVALARSEVVSKFRAIVPRINRVAGGLTVIAGAYVAYYGWYEWRVVRNNGDPDDPVIDAALNVQRRLQDLMPHTGNYGWYVAAAVTAIVAALVWSARSTGGDEDAERVAGGVGEHVQRLVGVGEAIEQDRGAQ
jgi:cytochrome c-type biogenesis protein